MKINHVHDYKDKRPNPSVLVCDCGRFQHAGGTPIVEIPVHEPMFDTGGPVEGLQRCPDCHRLPDLKIEDKGPDDKSSFRFVCERHGHLAIGETIEGTTALWNIYVMSFRKGGPNER